VAYKEAMSSMFDVATTVAGFLILLGFDFGSTVVG
jgi:hypothetical protein